MRLLGMMSCLLALGMTNAGAIDAAGSRPGPYLGHQRPAAKTVLMQDSGRGPETVPKSGGDTLEEALQIPGLPFHDSGETCTGADDYDAPCSYASDSPDLVYSFTPVQDLLVDIDLCGSAYDTKVFILDAGLNVLACNEDFYPPGDACGDYVSRLRGAALAGGQEVFIVIDGYGGDCGAYEIAVAEFVPCEMACAGEVLEGEPTLHDSYVDRFNGGCNSPGAMPPYQTLQASGTGTVNFCGVSGFYGGERDYRDTDWFAITLGPTGEVVWQLNAEQRTVGYVLPLDCADPRVFGVVVGGPCASGSIVINGQPGAHVALWVAPPVYTPPLGMPGFEYDYSFALTGLSPHQAVAVERVTWGAVKSSYR